MVSWIKVLTVKPVNLSSIPCGRCVPIHTHALIHVIKMILSWGVGANMPQCVEVRGQSVGAGSLLPAYGLRELNSGSQAWWKVPLLREPPPRPCTYF